MVIKKGDACEIFSSVFYKKEIIINDFIDIFYCSSTGMFHFYSV